MFLATSAPEASFPTPMTGIARSITTPCCRRISPCACQRCRAICHCATLPGPASLCRGRCAALLCELSGRHGHAVRSMEHFPAGSVARRRRAAQRIDFRASSDPVPDFVERPHRAFFCSIAPEASPPFHKKLNSCKNPCGSAGEPRTAGENVCRQDAANKTGRSDERNSKGSWTRSSAARSLRNAWPR
jgi:hypothetical protein